MSRILLADDSPHAQRIGETILREEGFEVVTVTDGETALVRLNDVDPDLIVADVFLPLKSGYEICRHVKNHPRFQHTRVILTAGALEGLDEEEARRVGADALIRKPFEASAVLATVKPLIDSAVLARTVESSAGPAAGEIDAERVRAAVTVALDAAMPALIDEITEKVLVALDSPWKKSVTGNAVHAREPNPVHSTERALGTATPVTLFPRALNRTTA